MNKIKRINLLVCCCLFAALGVSAALNICRKCGYENEAESTVCKHCSVAVPIKVAVDSDGAGSDDAKDDKEYLPVELVNADVALGRQHVEKRRYEIARLFFRNGLAMNSLTDPSDDGKRAHRLLQMIKECEHAGRTVVRKCPRCVGEGRAKAKLSGLTLSNNTGKKTLGDGVKPIQRAVNKKCERCKGSGTVRATGTIEDMKFEAGKASSSYRELQQARKYEPMGNIWLPMEIVEGLSIRQKAVLMRSIVSPCDYCSGFGRLDCRKCKGNGRTECGNRECKNGKVPSKTKSLTGMERGMTGKCSECRGNGTTRCESCSGEGSTLCDRCQGSGESETCDKCDARGYGECKKCSGTGEYRGVSCKYCGGEGESLCSSCRGEGHKK